ncbi:prepilin-type N-terminal cleavage/methylation domain-containing protein [Clostridium sp. Sa3CUN1]|uniref:Prepilin-type N-terminal cleavage/methylation domain-containing protein n=1 Tax=Clostridium gallinarum TaxID=2762246 RepID=A0ABR8Q8K4_9CLOT|nr:prepilin-type N-terminal cleavage/methylation domain-containing protein [Clostridium gallinarum]
MKKGYTLIEVIIVLSIISLISSIAIVNISKVKENLEVIEFKNSANEVKALLSFAKAYCRKNKVHGQIIVGSDRKTIAFEVSDKNHSFKKIIKLSKNIEVGSNFKVSSSITSANNNVTDEGYIKSAGTITLMYKNNRKIEITISVGNDISRTYESDNEDGDVINEEG